MKISIVIPNWNGEAKMQHHLPKVLLAAKTNNCEEVIVVDDASSDNSLEILKDGFPDIKVITKKSNSGFSTTVNVGVAASIGDFVVLLNNDASPEEDFLKFALPHFKGPKVFSIGFNVGGLWARGEFRDGFFWHQPAIEEANKKILFHKTLWSSGGSAIFRKSIWQELGGLDELFDPFYEEDLDLGYRAMKRGYINIWESRSKVDHYQEKGVISSHFSQSKIARIAQRNQLFFIWKNITSQKLFSQHQQALFKMLIAHPGYFKVFLSAAVKLPIILDKRQREMKESVVTDEDILGVFAKS